MASFLSKILSPKSNKSIQAPAIPVHQIEDAVEKPERSLLHLVKLNHVKNSVWAHKTLSDSMTACNIVPQHLISAFLLGADNTLLGEIFDLDSKVLEQWQPSPGEVVGEDWMDFLGKREYERAFLDFFEDALVEEGYDWKAVLHKFLFTGEQPLISSITAGLGQPLIHLSLALQMTSRDLALEALTLVATSYYDNDIYKYSDDASYFSTESLYKYSSLSSIINRVREDTRFHNETIALPGEHNMTIIFRDHEVALLDHCNAWTMSSNLTTQLQEMQKFSVALLLGARNPKDQQHDKCLLFPLLMSHAIHVLLPHIPANVQIRLVHQWWLTTLAIFVAQLRPEVDFDVLAAYESEDEIRDWKWFAQQATKSSHASDAYFVHTLRVLRDLGHAWPDSEDYFLRAGVKFAKEFSGWNEISL